MHDVGVVRRLSVKPLRHRIRRIRSLGYVMGERLGEKLLSNRFGHGSKDTAVRRKSAGIALRMNPANG
jgi:hypothetical protein